MPVQLLAFAGTASADIRLALREIGASPPPIFPSLLARHWFAARDGLKGHYLFSSEAGLRAFEQDPERDFAFRKLDRSAMDFNREVRAINADNLFERPIFIIGAPRSGTTLLFELMTSAYGLWSVDSEAHGPIEGIGAFHPASRNFDSHALAAEDATQANASALKAGLAARLVDHRRRSWLGFHPAKRPERIRLVEKTPENVLRIPLLAQVFPDALFVFLYRDARSNVSSLVEAWKHGGFVNLPRLPGWPHGPWCFLLPPGWQTMAGRPLPELCAFQWAAANERALDDLTSLEPSRWMALEFEELVATPSQVACRIARFAGIEEDQGLIEASERPLRPSATTISPPSPIKWRSRRDFDPACVTPYREISARLRHLLEQSPSPEARPPDAGVRFACLLEKLEPRQAGQQPEIVNPSLALQLGSTPPASVLRRLGPRTRFLGGRPILWTSDPATGVLGGCWAKVRDAAALLQLVPGAPAPPLSPLLAGKLRTAGVIASRSALEARELHGSMLVRRARNRLERTRFAKLEGLLASPQRQALADYYQRLIEAGGWALGDAQVERRFGRHNEPVAASLHRQLTAFVSDIAGQRVKPAYCYVSAYRGAAILRPHLDRLQCDFTVSVVVDLNACAREWPLRLLTGMGARSVKLKAGDAVIFRGCELPHWRGRGRSDAQATMILLHYVTADFAGVLS